MTEVLLISGMMLVTFSVRLLPFALADRIRLPPLLARALHSVPIAVLSAIIAPAVVIPKGEVWLAWNNPYLIAGFVSVVTAAVTRKLLLTIIIGVLTAFVVRVISG